MPNAFAVTDHYGLPSAPDMLVVREVPDPPVRLVTGPMYEGWRAAKAAARSPWPFAQGDMIRFFSQQPTRKCVGLYTDYRVQGVGWHGEPPLLYLCGTLWEAGGELEAVVFPICTVAEAQRVLLPDRGLTLPAIPAPPEPVRTPRRRRKPRVAAPRPKPAAAPPLAVEELPGEAGAIPLCPELALQLDGWACVAGAGERPLLSWRLGERGGLDAIEAVPDDGWIGEWLNGISEVV